MSEPQPTNTATRQTQRFRPAFPRVRLDDAQKKRQATITDAAWRAFRDRDRIIAFLNTPDARLGGRPLDLATDGDAGLAAVLAHLATVEEGKGDEA